MSKPGQHITGHSGWHVVLHIEGQPCEMVVYACAGLGVVAAEQHFRGQ